MHITSPGARALAPTIPAISASFTPGPWREHSHRQIGPDEGIVCEVWSAIGWGNAAIQQADANVRLIAAAPDLLAALETADMALIGYLPAHRNDVTDAAIGAARAAITKATGEAA